MSISDIRNNGLNPLSYLGVQSYSPVPLTLKTINPTPTDSQNFTIGSMWLNKTTQQYWALVNLAQGVATWVQFTSGAGPLLSLTGNSGGAVFPTAGNINVVGTGVITVVDNPGTSTLTITPSGAIASSFITSPATGTATPASGVLTFAGAGSVVVSATGSTVTITGSDSGTVTGLVSEDGNTVTPTAGVINIAGGSNLTTTGTVGPNTLTVRLFGITQHDVQVGGASNSLTQVSPSATSGVPLISNGSSSDPSFGTAVVAGGGTGKTSFVAYAPIVGGTTTTGALQQATTGFSTSGYVLTSTGSTSLPTWQAASISSINTQVFTYTGSSQTYTPTSGMTYCIIEVVGAGGGGGGGGTTGNNVAVAGGGGGGGYARGLFTASSIGASKVVTVGAGGTAGSAGANAGGTGGTTSVGSIISATGGSGSAGAAPNTVSNSFGGLGGVGTGGDFQTVGNSGGMGMGYYSSATLWVNSLGGGNSFWGGDAQPFGIISGSTPGAAAQSYGGGGGGAMIASNSTQQAGAAGFAGIVIITEYVAS